MTAERWRITRRTPARGTPAKRLSVFTLTKPHTRYDPRTSLVSRSPRFMFSQKYSKVRRTAFSTAHSKLLIGYSCGAGKITAVRFIPFLFSQTIKGKQAQVQPSSNLLAPGRVCVKCCYAPLMHVGVTFRQHRNSEARVQRGSCVSHAVCAVVIQEKRYTRYACILL